MGEAVNDFYPVYKLILKAIIADTVKGVIKKDDPKALHISSKSENDRLNQAVKVLFGVREEEHYLGRPAIDDSDIARLAFEYFYIDKKSHEKSQCVRFAAKALKVPPELDEKGFIRRISRKMEFIYTKHQADSKNDAPQKMQWTFDESEVESDFLAFNRNAMREQVCAILKCLIENNLLSEDYISSDIIHKINSLNLTK